MKIEETCFMEIEKTYSIEIEETLWKSKQIVLWKLKWYRIKKLVSSISRNYLVCKINKYSYSIFVTCMQDETLVSSISRN